MMFTKKLTLRLAFLTIVFGMAAKSHAQAGWERPALVEPNAVEMGGAWGDALSRGLKRIELEPYTAPFVLADLNFGMERWFTNFSGDISGRFLELSSLNSSCDNPQPTILKEVMSKIPALQKPDGHFGADIDWTQPIDFSEPFKSAKMMPTMWGNGRMLLGLVAAYERFGDPRFLSSARKLGDFYIDIAAERFCDPKRVDEYKKSPGYAAAYVTCVFQGGEGLVRLHRVSGDGKYLKVAERMADFHALYDTLPVEHSHGSISVHEALLMLFEDTGDPKYLKRVSDRWSKAVTEGYVNPAGGVLEKFVVTGYNRDEGCAEADWLRLNLMLWRDTGNTQYLDMAERLLWTGYLANQWPDGGYGHRHLSTDSEGVYGFGTRAEEAIWCCNFHGPLGLHDLKSYLAVGSPAGIYYNFPVEFKTTVQIGNAPWVLTSKVLPPAENIPVHCEITVSGTGHVPVLVRIPEWADEVVLQLMGKTIPAVKAGGYLRTPPLASGDKLGITYQARPHLETRRGERIKIPSKLPAKLPDVVVRQGPGIFVSSSSGDVRDITLKLDPNGAIQLSKAASAELVPWVNLESRNAPHAFVFNVTLE